MKLSSEINSVLIYSKQDAPSSEVVVCDMHQVLKVMIVR